MLNNYLTLLAVGRGIGEILPFLILMAIYAISAIIKSKQQKQKGPPPRPRQEQPPAQPTTPTRRLPSYARDREMQPQPSAQRPTSQPRPTRVPQQAAPKGRPVIPPSAAPKRVPRMAQPAPTRPAQQPSRKPVATEAARRIAQITPAAAPKKKKSSAATRRQAAQKIIFRPPGTVASTAQRVQLGLDLSSNLARAIVYAEVLGKPLALRPNGSFELND